MVSFYQEELSIAGEEKCDGDGEPTHAPVKYSFRLVEHYDIFI